MTEITGQTPPPPDPSAGKQIDLSPLNLTPEATERIEAGRNAFLFGAYMEPMIEAGIRHVGDRSMNPTEVGQTLGVVSDLFRQAGEDYERQPGHLAGDALTTHQENVKNGEIKGNYVPREAEMNETNRIEELTRANKTFSKLPPRIQAIIAELNYEAFFRPKTMADAEATLATSNIDDLIASQDKDYEHMDNLKLTNRAIAEIISGMLLSTSVSESPIGFRIIDTGSGPGATLASITERLKNTEITNNPEIAITGIETTQGFYNQLQEFTESDQAIAGLGLKVRSLGPNIAEGISETGTLTTIKSDTLSALKSLDLSSAAHDEIVVITGNYSWHRLDSRTKQEIMDLFKDVPNIIFIIGDFAIHGNDLAKRFFCLGANGPLNTGNIGLPEQFTDSGYSLVDLEKERPASLDPRIAERIAKDDKDPNIDGHLWIAHRGELAKKALNLVAA